MESKNDNQSWLMSSGFAGGFFLLFLLISIINLWSSVVAGYGHGWYLEFGIAAPWVFVALTGSALYVAIKRGNISQKVGGPLLMNLGFIVLFTYEAMSSLGKLGH
jgi:hypothetical protein